ncbi:TPA: hypothetical protein ACW36B_000618 [Campylobacter jejuni]|uniref:Uncharacterized protein n=3 Tax=Campylobacter jejuni TaxID=197 RepID=A0A1E7NVY4_CAMJU|nr:MULTISPECIES: hypothetical protein [Campylobacter]AGQ95563.1 hypothetical protein M635_00840 [Campylobacter jejuni 32488]AHW91339.1 hypothetical protein H730_02025 [Campylobacter jejuni subsp. jejuni R14]AJK83181.1 hypothetical protein PJ19_06565 [Campylobacter jejuni subsp. jejuni]AJK85014.1 hypothetical protein PJ16_06300 [Campylobacter jejuni subsp. jejuni]ALM60693.1 hypothetical protein ASB61_08435 [Campylobacter jejuni]
MDNIVSANKLRNQNAILNPKENDDQKALFLKEKQEFEKEKALFLKEKQEFEKEKALFLKEKQKTLEENEETIINESLKNKETKKGKQDK